MPLTLSRTARPPVGSEYELVAATRAGDDRAFEELYARYRERIFSFILSKVHDHGRAEDIAQDVFMSALRRLRGSDQVVAFKPWIYEIAKNACIDEFRRGSRSKEVPLESDGEFVTDRQNNLSVVPTPAAAVESKQRLDDLRRAFGGLSESHHRMLVMREFEGMSYDEIGERLDMTRQMVESGLFRARRKLTEEYEELASGRRCQQVQTAIDVGALQSVASLGLKDRRRIARHLSHCQPCRHAALVTGVVDETLLKPRRIPAKIAALLPFPLWRFGWPGRGGRAGVKAASASGSHHVAAAGSLATPAASGVTIGQVAAAVAALAVAGGGAGIAHGLTSGPAHRSVHSTPARPPVTAPSHTAGSGVSVRPAQPASATKASAAGARAGVALKDGRSAIITAPAQSTGHRHNRSGQHNRGPAGGGAGTAKAGSGQGSATTPSGTAGTAGPRHAPVSGPAGTVTSTLGTTVKRTANPVTHPVQTVTKVVKGVGDVVGSVPTAVNGVASGAGSTVNGVASGAGSTVNGVASGAGSTVNGVTSGAGSTVNGVTSGAGSTVQKVVKGATGSGSGSSPSAGSNPLTPTTSAVSSAASSVTQPVQSVVSTTAGPLSK
jgi:RNA polymerase sigma factor (sigma-70 family)